MKYKIVADASCNVNSFALNNVSLTFIHEIKDKIDQVSNKLSLDWLEAFGDADVIFGITITNKLSDSFQAAMNAKAEYEKKYPHKKVFIIDSLSVGPEISLMIYKLADLMKNKLSYQEIRNEALNYLRHTRLMFSLPSLNNIAINGIISPALAKKINATKRNLIGKAGYDGHIEPIKLCRSKNKTLKKLYDEMKENGYCGGRVIISHTNNQESSLTLSEIIKKEYPDVSIEINNNQGLSLYYVETGGILVGFEA